MEAHILNPFVRQANFFSNSLKMRVVTRSRTTHNCQLNSRSALPNSVNYMRRQDNPPCHDGLERISKCEMEDGVILITLMMTTKHDSLMKRCVRAHLPTGNH